VSTTLASVIARAKRRYGLDDATVDPFLSDTLFIDRVNECLKEAGEQAGGFREEFTLNLSSSTGRHALSSRVLSVVDGSVRVDYDGSGNFYTEPARSDEDELRHYYGALDQVAAGVPDYYYLQRAATVDAMLELVLFPRSDTARTGGLKLWALTVPADLTATSDTLPVQLTEERYLLPGLMLALAEAQANRGRADAPVAYWSSRWAQALTDWRTSVEVAQRGTLRRIHHTGDYADWG
jgi:hypothetical protein